MWSDGPRVWGHDLGVTLGSCKGKKETALGLGFFPDKVEISDSKVKKIGAYDDHKNSDSYQQLISVIIDNIVWAHIVCANLRLSFFFNVEN